MNMKFKNGDKVWMRNCDDKYQGRIGVFEGYSGYLCTIQYENDKYPVYAAEDNIEFFVPEVKVNKFKVGDEVIYNGSLGCSICGFICKIKNYINPASRVNPYEVIFENGVRYHTNEKTLTLLTDMPDKTFTVDDFKYPIK